MQHSIKHDEFFKFFFVYTIIMVLYSTAVAVMPAWLPQAPAANSTLMLILGSLASLMSLAGFVLNIVAIVLIVKRKYRKLFLWLPISYFVLGIVGAVIGLVVSISLMAEQFNALGADATPAEMQAVAESFANNPPLGLMIFVLVRGLILLGLTVWLWLAAQREAKPEIAK